jgi:hypothetical protein
VSVLHTRYAVECIELLARERRCWSGRRRPLQVVVIGREALGVGYPHGRRTPCASGPTLFTRPAQFPGKYPVDIQSPSRFMQSGTMHNMQPEPLR